MPWTADFEVTHEKTRRVDVLDSSDSKGTSKACNKAFKKLVETCQEKTLFNLRGEEYEELAIVGVTSLALTFIVLKATALITSFFPSFPKPFTF